jgi:two-component sensor histidine kinase
MPDKRDERPAPDLNRVLILAPLRKDSEYLAELLSKHSIESESCEDEECLQAALRNPPGILVVTHEALSEPILQCVAAHLREQPDWSELPIVVLLDKAGRAANVHSVLALQWPRSRIVFYHRPVATLELLSGIQSLLLARHRQRDVRDHLERELELRRELNHRVKNILASVLSILHLTRRSATSVDEMCREFEGRLTALAEVHSAVVRAGGESVDLAMVVETTVAPYRNGSRVERISASGPPLTITRDAGTALALSLHELVTNALKYGALSVPEGKVQLRWAVSGDAEPLFELEWKENGGPELQPPTRVGYGTRYLKAALTGLLGREPKVEYRRRGLRFVASGPLSRIAGQTSAHE